MQAASKSGSVRSRAYSSFRSERNHAVSALGGNMGAATMFSSPDGISYIQAAIGILCCVLGAGIVSISVAFASTGWYGVIFITVCGILAAYTGGLLGECGDRFREIEAESIKRNLSKDVTDAITYGDLGEASYGFIGRLIASVSQMGVAVGACTVYLYLFGTTMSDLARETFEWTGIWSERHIWTILCAVTLLPTAAMRTLKEMHLVSMLGFATSVYLACVLLFTGIFAPDQYKAYEAAELPNARDTDGFYTSQISVSSFLRAFGIFAFAFAGHSIFLELRSSMAHPSQFGRSAALAYFISALLYLLLCAFIFYSFGHVIIDGQMNDLLAALKPNNWAISARFALVAHLMVGVIFFCNPVFLFVESLIGIEVTDPDAPYEAYDNEGEENVNSDPHNPNKILPRRMQQSSLYRSAAASSIQENNNNNNNNIFDSEHKLGGEFRLDPASDRIAFENETAKEDDVSNHNSNKEHTFKNTILCMLLIRWALLASFLFIALFTPSLPLIQSLTGAVFYATQSFVLPALFKLKLYQLHPGKTALKSSAVIDKQLQDNLNGNTESGDVKKMLLSTHGRNDSHQSDSSTTLSAEDFDNSTKLCDLRNCHNVFGTKAMSKWETTLNWSIVIGGSIVGMLSLYFNIYDEIINK